MGLRKGICPNCGSTEVYAGTNRSEFVKNRNTGNGLLPINWRHSASIENFVCTTCGYLESYVAATDKLLLIRELWRPVNEPPEEKQKRKNDEL